MSQYHKQLQHAFKDLATGVSTEVISADPQRVWLLLQNDSADVMYLTIGTGPAVMNQGIRLASHGGSVELSRETGFHDVRAIHAIHGGAGNARLLLTWA